MDINRNISDLRPYYDENSFNAGYSVIFKPDSGIIDPYGFNIASRLNVVQKGSKKLGLLTGDGERKVNDLTMGLNTRFLNIFGDYSDGGKISVLNNLELPDILNYKVWKSLCERLLHFFIKKYFQHIIQIPFDIARFLLQVGDFDNSCGAASNKRNQINSTRSIDYNENSDEEVDYFPKVGLTVSGESIDSVSESKTSTLDDSTAMDVTIIKPTSLHTMDILNSVMNMEGTRGIWRANNATFIYNFLWQSIHAWFTGLFSPFMQIPDPHFADIIHSSDVQKSVSLTVIACIFTGLILLPLDLIKTKLVITKIGDGRDRSLRRLFRKWSWKYYLEAFPAELIVLNIAHSLVGRVFSDLTHIGLHQYYQIERCSNLFMFRLLEFFSSCAQLFLKLPVEALLRRCQVHFLLHHASPFQVKSEDLIVKPRNYQNLFNTLREYHRLKELWSGWRIGFISVICSHGLNIKLQDIDPDEQEKF